MARTTLQSDVTITTTNAIVTGLSFPVLAGRTYRFKILADVTVGATADGVLINCDGPALTRLNYSTRSPLTTTTEQFTHGNNAWKNAGTSVTPGTTSPATVLCAQHVVEGTVTPSVDGTVAAWAVVEAGPTGTPAVKAGSTVEYHLVK